MRILLLLFGFAHLGNSLQCWSCENNGVCNNYLDNGILKECRQYESCQYLRGENYDGYQVIIRGCADQGNNGDCYFDSINVNGSMVQFQGCYCHYDGCNQYDQCPGCNPINSDHKMIISSVLFFLGTVIIRML